MTKFRMVEFNTIDNHWVTDDENTEENIRI